jgi:hypothetical protein
MNEDGKFLGISVYVANSSMSAVKRLCQRLELRSKHLRKYKATTYSKHYLPIAPKVLERQITNA